MAEALVVLALGGLGYLVTQSTAKAKKVNATRPVISPSRREGRLAEGFATLSPADYRKSATQKGSPSELDQMYQNTYGKTYPMQPNPPGPSGLLPTNYAQAREKSVAFDTSPYGLGGAGGPGLESVSAATPSVAMNPSGIEENPNYSDGDYVISPLSGEKMTSSDFTHNNMQPFFGGRVKQNVNVDTNTSVLDTFTGAGTTQVRKQEVETMFNTNKTPFGNPYGLEDATDFIQSRVEDPALRRRDGERPFEPVRVAAALGEKFGATGKGGFQQYEVNEFMMKNLRKTDDLRTADNPKSTYKGVVVPGNNFVTKSMESPGEVRKYKPDAFFIDESGERFVGAFSEEGQRETSRPIQVMPYTTRADTSSEFIGPAASQEFGENYVAGTYRTPMAQQYGGAGFRNADMEGYYTADPDSPEADYGRSSIEIRPNERLSTGERTMGLNLVPADTGLVTVPYTDESRPTRRAETVGNIRQTGTATGYAGGAPAVTVWDPTDVARTTVKETTLKWDYRGIAAPADGPTRLTVYDPDDIARPTQKAQISAKSEYFGGVKAATEKFTSHQASYNMRLNPSKEQVAKGRKPYAGNGGIGIFNTNVNQSSKKLDVDILNDRALAVNRVEGLPPGAGDIGQVKYRAPLKLDISVDRNTQEMVDAVMNNPLQQSLQLNAQKDEISLQEYLRTHNF